MQPSLKPRVRPVRLRPPGAHDGARDGINRIARAAMRKKLCGSSSTGATLSRSAGRQAVNTRFLLKPPATIYRPLFTGLLFTNDED